MATQYTYLDDASNIVHVVLKDENYEEESQYTQLVEDDQQLEYVYADEVGADVEWLESEEVGVEEEATVDELQYEKPAYSVEKYFTINILSDGWLKCDTFLKRYECQRCEPHVSFPRIVELICHSLLAHNSLLYKCNVCGESCETSAIESHLQTHERASISLNDSSLGWRRGQEEEADDDLDVSSAGVKRKNQTKILTYVGDYDDDVVVGSKLYRQIEWSGQKVLVRKLMLNDLVLYKCKVCIEMFENTEQLVDHMARYHAKDFIPAVARKPRVNSYAKRIKELTGKWPKSVREANARELQLENEEMSDEKPNEKAERKKLFSCEVCGMEFSTVKKLTRHCKCHAESEAYKCEFCPKSFARKSNMLRHIKIHTGEKPYACKFCDETFSTYSVYRRHQMIHSGKANPGPSGNARKEKFVCAFCGKVLASRQSLQTHLRLHTQEKPFECAECHKRFYSNNALKLHALDHTGERPFSCSFCEKSFKQMISLQNHERTHTGEKPYQCQICGRAFSNVGSLFMHKITHTGEKRFKCDECGREYTNRSNLARHKALHLGLKRFSCSICCKQFTQRVSLKDHMTIHTGEKPHMCTECGKSFTSISTLGRHVTSKHKQEIHQEETSPVTPIILHRFGDLVPL